MTKCLDTLERAGNISSSSVVIEKRAGLAGKHALATDARGAGCHVDTKLPDSALHIKLGEHIQSAVIPTLCSCALIGNNYPLQLGVDEDNPRTLRLIIFLQRSVTVLMF